MNPITKENIDTGKRWLMATVLTLLVMGFILFLAIKYG
jgi:hypothetical protein